MAVNTKSQLYGPLNQNNIWQFTSDKHIVYDMINPAYIMCC